jgi:hypothetical protein
MSSRAAPARRQARLVVDQDLGGWNSGATSLHATPRSGAASGAQPKQSRFVSSTIAAVIAWQLALLPQQWRRECPASAGQVSSSAIVVAAMLTPPPASLFAPIIGAGKALACASARPSVPNVNRTIHMTTTSAPRHGLEDRGTLADSRRVLLAGIDIIVQCSREAVYAALICVKPS